MEFKTGDIVRLKSGGPEMTVDESLLSLDGKKVHCLWFAREKLESGDFSPEALIKVEEYEGPREQPASASKPRKRGGAR
jgi:uncharacterized protein YodC (DUF2158 family)